MLRLIISFLFSFSVASGLMAQPIIGISYPPIKDSTTRDFTLQKLPQIGVTYIRIGEQWKNREPQRGKFNWKPLKNRIDSLSKQNLKIVLTIQTNGPDWACAKSNYETCIYKDFSDFEPYINQLLSRYGDKLDAIQFGNEWDNLFVGSAQEYVNLQNKFYDLVKKNNPNLTVILGGITARAYLYQAICEQGEKVDQSEYQFKKQINLNVFLNNEICKRKRQSYIKDQTEVRFVFNNAKYDIADIHLYDIPDLWPLFIKMMKRDTKKPIYVTEFGGPNPDLERSDPQYQANRLEVYLKTISTLPVLRAYYFKLTDGGSAYHNLSGLFDENGKEKPALKVVKDR